jgi:hypothetical protein
LNFNNLLEDHSDMAHEKEHINQIEIFQTGKLWEIDVARDALRQNDIPFFVRTDSISGVRTALDAMPTAAPGVFWCLVIPDSVAPRAKEILRQCRLDVEKDPLIWDFAPSQKGKQFWKTCAWFVLILGAILLMVSRLLSYR